MSAPGRTALVVSMVGLMSPSVCRAQPAASLLATHNHSTGLVAPGEVVQLRFTLSWTDAVQFAAMGGDAIASPNVGIASNPQFHPNPFVLPGSTTINPGTPSGGSVLGVDIRAGGALAFLPGAPFGYMPWFYGPITMLTYDWTAPDTPGVVMFDWNAPPGQPNPLMYITPLSTSLGPVPTTYLGTSLTVIPAPGTALAAFAFGLVASRRSRGAGQAGSAD